MTSTNTGALWRAFTVVGLVIGVTAILYFGQVVLVPVALAGLLTFILLPGMTWLERHGTPRFVSVTLMTLLAGGIVGSLFWVALTQLQDLAHDLPNYADNIKHRIEPVQELLKTAHKAEKAISELPKDAKERAGADRRPDEAPTKVVVEPPNTALVSWLPALAWPALDAATRTFLVTVLMLFMLAQHESLRNRLIRLLGRRNLTSTTKAMDDAAHRLSRYLLLQLATNAAFGLLAGIGLYFIGVPYAFLWGLLTVTLRFIPYVGVWLAGALPFTLSIALFPDWWQPLMVLGMYACIELILANAIEPLLFGHGTGVLPVALLVAAVFWAWLWGPLGLLLSTPLTVCLVVLGKHVRGLRFLEVLLADEPALDAPARYYQRLLAGDTDEATVVLREELQQCQLERAFDGIMLPALVRAKGERAQDELSTDETRSIYRSIRDVLENVAEHCAAKPPEGTAPKAPAASNGKPPVTPVRVIGCPLQGMPDKLALDMLSQLLAEDGHDLTVMPSSRFIERLGPLQKKNRPLVVCIAAVPPHSLAEAAQLCKRIRARSPEVKILVGRWGKRDQVEADAERLRKAGADHVATKLVETLAHVNTLAAPSTAVTTAAS